MKTYNNLYKTLCSFDNLETAFNKARKGKTLKVYVIVFEKDLKNNLIELRTELLLHSYRPRPLKTFILRDPKTRKISKSDFRDMVVHHALCNIISPILEKKFIHDSYANQKGKGVLAAIKRFEVFKRRITKNFTKIHNTKNVKGFVLKADVRKFFDTVKHNILVNIIKRTIKDERVIWLIKTILANHSTKTKGVGMPLGNLTSQFFANVFLNELDQYVKRNLKAKHYIRYVDDFVILHRSKETLEYYKQQIDMFLRDDILLELHPDKSKIFPLYRGTDFLGLKIFPYHKIIRQKKIRRFRRKLEQLCSQYDEGTVDYDKLYDVLEGWYAHSKNANTYKLRSKIFTGISDKFEKEMSDKELNRHLKTCL